MKILVPMKQVPDPALAVRVTPEGTLLHGGSPAHEAKAVPNPFDEIALEAALQLKEAGHAGEVVAVAIGPEPWRETLRTALAMGADRAILVLADPPLQEPLTVARALAALARRERPGVILCGKQGVDGDHHQVGPMTAALLGWPQASGAARIQLTGGDALVTREVDGGEAVKGITLPAVISADLRLNTPRYASLPNIMKARRKPLETLPLAELGVDVAPRTRVISLAPPASRPPGVRVADVAQLAAALQRAGVWP